VLFWIFGEISALVPLQIAVLGVVVVLAHGIAAFLVAIKETFQIGGRAGGPSNSTSRSCSSVNGFCR
jgi:hypothetical protein